MNIEKPVILFGIGRSGTTFISEALFRNRKLGFPSNYLEKKPDAQYLNLARYLFDNKIYRIFGRKSQINKASVFHRVVFKSSEAYPIWKHLTKDDVDFSREFLHNKKASPEVVKRAQDYFNMMLSLQGKERLGFKITGPSRISYLLNIFPDARFLRITRKFLPTLNSFLNVKFWQNRGKNDLWWKGVYSDDDMKFVEEIKDDQILLTAFQLKKVLQITEKEIKENNFKIKEISYENFTENPLNNLKEIFDWFELPHDADSFNYLKKNKIINTNKDPEEYFSLETLNKLQDKLEIDIT